MLHTFSALLAERAMILKNPPSTFLYCSLWESKLVSTEGKNPRPLKGRSWTNKGFNEYYFNIKKICKKNNNDNK